MDYENLFDKFSEELDEAREKIIISVNHLWNTENEEFRRVMAQAWTNCNRNREYFSTFMKCTFKMLDPDNEDPLMYSKPIWDYLMDAMIANIEMDLNAFELKVEE